MKKHIKELKDIHKGADIWIIASGPSMSFVDPSFFDNKITIGLNQVYKKYNCDYLIRKEFIGLTDAFCHKGKSELIVSEYDCGDKERLNEIEVEGTYWYFEHKPNQHAKVDLSVIGSDLIVVSYSTITSAMHVAAHMGAKNIMLCGFDCTTINGVSNFEGYYADSFKSPAYESWLEVIEPATIAVRDRLQEAYGCNVHSLNPFVNLRLEGHKLGESVNGIKCSIVLPVHDQLEQMQECLQSVIENTPEQIYEMVIVDNASLDGTKGFLRRLEGDVKIITNRTNAGQSVAFNQGTNEAEGRYLVFLSNNARPEKGWLEEMLEVVEKSHIAAVQKADMLLLKRHAFAQAGMFDARDPNPLGSGNLHQRLHQMGYQVSFA